MTTSGHILALDEEARISARRIFSLISTELMQVELEFERQARSNVQVIDYLGEYLRASGGKRVRPALTILSNYAVGGDGARYNSIRMATVMEFLHTATLVHDDVIDKADTRRKRPPSMRFMETRRRFSWVTGFTCLHLRPASLRDL